MSPTDNPCCCGQPAGHPTTAPICIRTALQVLQESVSHIQTAVDDLKVRVLAPKVPQMSSSSSTNEVTDLVEWTNEQPAQPKQQQFEYNGPRMVELDENLFQDAPQDASLCHCVGGDFVMGKGLAVEMRQRYCPDPVLRYLRSRKWRPGQVAAIPLSIDGRVTRYIFHLVTKPFSRYCLPRREELRRTIRELAHQCHIKKIPVLAMPQIGAGLDRQPWQWVRQVILQEFRGLNIDILVYRHPGEGRGAFARQAQRKPEYVTQPDFSSASSFAALAPEEEKGNPDNSSPPDILDQVDELKPENVQNPQRRSPHRLATDLEKMMVRRGLPLPVLDGETNQQPQLGPGAALNGAKVLSTHQGGVIGRVDKVTRVSEQSASASGPARQGESVSFLKPNVAADESRSPLPLTDDAPVSSLSRPEPMTTSNVVQPQPGPGAALNGATELFTHQGGVIGRVGEETRSQSASGPARQGESSLNLVADVSAEMDGSFVSSSNEAIVSSVNPEPDSDAEQPQPGPGAAINGATELSTHQGGVIGRVDKETKISEPSASGPTRQAC
ncbi:uncharacterized protein LOC132204855 isoform X1 [Neocloeon triangulifer]|uniref:uncharacterized protein LOC132204855 isoform X1 n=1 Tax=Neocloeon triangulifer TaxID=2078957 RepID=UPI00286F37C1|nr:uncharacterized protein LOC132204855 isoform X1 [Neocloeon triangulifer]